MTLSQALITIDKVNVKIVNISVEYPNRSRSKIGCFVPSCIPEIFNLISPLAKVIAYMERFGKVYIVCKEE